MFLAAYATGRDNNFNLIRFLAAFAVLWSHGFAIALGPGTEPWARIGHTAGGIAVDVFFVTSGFLVAASLLRLQDLKAFARARALRIFPALAVMAVLVAVVLGGALTRLPADAFYADPGTWRFVAKNATALTGIQYRLPGVFETNPIEALVNGSLWTLPLELRAYILLALIWCAARYAGASSPPRFLRVMAVATLLSLAVFWVAYGVDHKQWHSMRLFFLFSCGAMFWTLRERIRMTARIGLPLAMITLVTVAVAPRAFFLVYPLTLAYLVLYVAYVPAGAIRGFNRIGDYSYGLYIYAFPVQQAIAHCVPGIAVWEMFVAATAITLPLAMLSWHLVEKPMLARK